MRSGESEEPAREGRGRGIADAGYRALVWARELAAAEVPEGRAVTPPRLLVTGPPGSGKTTLVRRVLGRLPGLDAAGFFTEEVRAGTGRTGFRVTSLDGRSGRLASVGGEGGPRVGRYAVHVAEFEAVALPALRPGPGVRLLVVDEIGKMECLSPAFVTAVREGLRGPWGFLGTVALAGGGFIAEARRLPGVEVVVLSRENRDRLPAEIAERLSAFR